MYNCKVADLNKANRQIKEFKDKYEKLYKSYNIVVLEREVIEMYKDINKLKGILDYKGLELDAVARTNGDILTFTIVTEECAELIQALSKVKRYGFKGDYKDNLNEEVADVIICIEELISLGYIDLDELKKWHKYKIDREIERAKKRGAEK